MVSEGEHDTLGAMRLPTITDAAADARKKRYRLRLIAAAGAGFACNTLFALALPNGNTPRSRMEGSVVLPLYVPGCLVFLAAVYLLGEIGHWTTRRTGTLGSGTWAAALAGVCFGLGDLVGTVLARTIIGVSLFDPNPGISVGVILLQTLNNTLTYGLLGLIAGLIGAAIGRSHYRSHRQDLQLQGEYRGDEAEDAQHGD